MSSNETLASGKAKVLLLDDDTDGKRENEGVFGRVWVESKKLWNIAGPVIFNRVANCTMIIITQAFAGHLGDLELAATSIAVNVILGLDIGLMLGMSSALETLCGQAFGAKKHYMLGVYMQRSWIILLISSVVLLPWFLFTTHILVLFGQPQEIAELAGVISMWLIPTHLAFAFFFPLHFFLQSQLKNKVIAWVSLVALVSHAITSWLVLYKFELGVISVVAAANVSWWIMVLGYFGYIVWGNCPSTWTGFSLAAFSGLWEFTTLSVASGVMICLEVWYDKVLMLMTGILHNAKTSVEALTICLSINIWQMMFPLSFLAAVGVRVANELGAGNGKGAKFATKVAVMTSFIISVFFWLLIMNFRSKFAYMFSSSEVVIEEVNKLSPLLGFTILLNSVQPVLSGVAVGSGWQKYVAYINLGCYYGIGLPLGYLLGFVFNLGVEGIWAGLIFGGTAVQTLILTVITIQCDWDKEAEKARLHLRKWEGSNKRTEE
ncbi:hypothetical protein TanjilG_20709 [Lupinus angustifolius]|uniref:Protein DETOXIFICATION n=1 Tax=Lupinus angustifolius TaxID=3871 RepID=A0A4P1QRJ8_LUPAN|nr:PREDICTED: protein DETOXIFICATION 27-like [Lupinus angustifolius]OIV93047.1 hypothetical protein TanjilG_20709 [Lupinus angustifolius]